MSAFTREKRYAVLKYTDVERAFHTGHLSDADMRALEHAAQKVDDFRASVGKPPLVSLVVESDWPEYEPTWKAIEKRMLGKASGRGFVTRMAIELEELTDRLSKGITFAGSDQFRELPFEDQALLMSQLAHMGQYQAALIRRLARAEAES